MPSLVSESTACMWCTDIHESKTATYNNDKNFKMCVYVCMYMCALVHVCVIGVGWKMMTWQLKVLVAPPEELGSVPRTHMVAYNYLARQWWHMPLIPTIGRQRQVHF